MVVVIERIEFKTKKFNLLKAEFQDFKFALEEVTRSYLKENRKNFILKGTGKYAPLSPKYAAQKSRKFGPLPILVVDGRLRDSVTDRQNQDSIRQVTKNIAVIGTRTPYAGFIQTGTNKMPARPFLFFTKDQEKRFTKIIEENTNKKIREINRV